MRDMQYSTHTVQYMYLNRTVECQPNPRARLRGEERRPVATADKRLSELRLAALLKLT